MNKFEKILFEDKNMLLITPGEPNSVEREKYINLIIEILFLNELSNYGNYEPSDSDRITDNIEKKLETFYNVNLVDIYYKRNKDGFIETAFFKSRILFGSPAGIDLPITIIKYKEHYYPGYNLLEDLLNREIDYFVFYKDGKVFDIIKSHSYFKIEPFIKKYEKIGVSSYKRMKEKDYRDYIKLLKEKQKNLNFELKMFEKFL